MNEREKQTNDPNWKIRIKTKNEYRVNRIHFDRYSKLLIYSEVDDYYSIQLIKVIKNVGLDTSRIRRAFYCWYLNCKN